MKTTTAKATRIIYRGFEIEKELEPWALKYGNNFRFSFDGETITRATDIQDAKNQIDDYLYENEPTEKKAFRVEYKNRMVSGRVEYDTILRADCPYTLRCIYPYKIMVVTNSGAILGYNSFKELREVFEYGSPRIKYIGFGDPLGLN